MKIKLNGKTSINDHLGCFGSFRMADPVCNNLCALSLRCAIEQELVFRTEVLEDLLDSDILVMPTQ